MRVLHFAPFIALLIAVGGCSLAGLDQVEATPCATVGTSDLTAAHATCARELAGSPLGDCEAHVCALVVGDDLFCTVGAPDVDGDRVGDAACVPEGTEALRDCNDEDPDIAEGREEICDGKDNNCDGRTDEEVLSVGEPTRRDSTEGASTEGLVGTAAVGDEVIAAFRRDIDDLASLHVLVDDAVPVDSDPTPEVDEPITLDDQPEDTDRGIAIAGDAGNVFAVFPASRCGRLSVGSIDSEGALTSTSYQTDSTGLPSAMPAGVACTDDVPQRAPAAAVANGSVLLAWLESGRRAACGTGVTAPLVLTTTDTAAELSSDLTDLGVANDSGPPALLAFGASGDFILARGEGDNLVVSSLRVVGSAISVLDTLTVAVGAAVEEVALTTGPTSADQTTLAVAYSKGCGSRGVVGLQRIALTRADGSLSPEGEETVVDEGPTQTEPAIAFGAEFPRGYFVIWREGDDRVRGQLLGEFEGQSGAAVEVLEASNLGGAAPTRIRGMGVAAGAEGGFTTLGYVEGAETAFFGTPVSCGGE